MIYTVAGNGTAGFSGDGGLAINASLNNPAAVCRDGAGNLYIADEMNHRIRKVDGVTNIITTIAGNGIPTFSGDGGPATSASLFRPIGVVVDGIGNIYIADDFNNRVRKVSPSGIITTIAGNGGTGLSGDGGLATAASIGGPKSVAMDAMGNLLIGDGNNRIRKVDGNGIITTVAGGGLGGFTEGAVPTSVQLTPVYHLAVDVNGDVLLAGGSGGGRFLRINNMWLMHTLAGTGLSGFSGDGGLAHLAQVFDPKGIASDMFGNAYLYTGGRLRHVDFITGIIHTIAGNGNDGFSGDGGPATSAEFSSAMGKIFSDPVGNIYIADRGNQRIRMVTSSYNATYISDSFSVFIDKWCNGPGFLITTKSYGSNYTLKTHFGDDGVELTTSVQLGFGNGLGYANFNHSYQFPGTYTLRTVLLQNNVPVDTLVYSYEHKLCNSIPMQIYNDVNNNCIFDTTETQPYRSSSIKIDSNNIAIDTLSITTGGYYKAYGNIGDIYKFTVISSLSGMIPVCPSTGEFSVTLQNQTYDPTVKYIALGCTNANSYDLSIEASLRTAANRSDINIVANNDFCLEQDALLTVTFSPKYAYFQSSIPPFSQSANTITWNLNALSSIMPEPRYLYVRLQDNGQILTPGDTVHTQISIMPNTGDVNIANNVIIRHDTVTGPYDPNAVYVSPSHCVIPGTRLQYTVTFENMGNAPAENIYIMDTLNSGFEMQSMKIIAASHQMNVTKVSEGGYNILKFEFPNINLPDSSSPDRHGMVMYEIDMVDNFPIGSAVTNKAGIYFDYMPAVLTNVASTTACWPANVNTATASNKGNILLYPNPATDELTIKTDKAYSNYIMTNSIGQVLLQRSLDSKEAKVNIKSLAPGMYYISLEGEHGTEVRKFVKM